MISCHWLVRPVYTEVSGAQVWTSEVSGGCQLCVHPLLICSFVLMLQCCRGPWGRQLDKNLKFHKLVAYGIAVNAGKSLLVV